MCLSLGMKKVRVKKPNKDGFCIGWKIVQLNNFAPFKSYFQYKLGENEAVLGKEYFPTLEIRYGFHFFTTRYAARVDILGWKAIGEGGKHKIIKVYYKPEDVIAYGSFSENNYLKAGHPVEWFDCVCVKKLTVRSLEPVR